jgi:hypothetical protein
MKLLFGSAYCSDGVEMLNVRGTNPRSLLGSLGLIAATVCAVLIGSAEAQVDPFGATDLVWVGSAEAAPGEQVQIGVFARNDEPLASLSIPLTFDPAILRLIAVDFAGSRGEHIQTKLVNPPNIQTADGHFLTGIMMIQEGPIEAGEGLLFTAIFEVSDGALEGAESTIDSLYFPPGGELILVEAATSGIIEPGFSSGTIIIRSEPNRPPAFAKLSTQYLNEGDSLNLNILAVDPDDDPLTINCVTRPDGAQFVPGPNGEGVLKWKAEFTGPSSAAAAPHTLIFRVTDSKVSTTLEVPINVVDINRRPVLTDLDPVTIDAGEAIELNLTAEDPDFDSLTWTITGQPEGMTLVAGSPAIVNWETTYADTGLFEIEVTVSDPQGYADSTSVLVTVNPTTIYTLAMDTVAGDPATIVDFNIELINEEPISSFNLLIHHDPTVLYPLIVTATGTRTEDFEYFSYELNHAGNPGDIRIEGIADLAQGGTASPINGGEGAICTISFRIVPSVAYSGMTAPVTFEFLDGPFGADNTMTTPLGVPIEQSEITYLNGYVYVNYLGDILIGDINLNGIAPEIGDAIFFSNYFMDPVGYNLDPLQVANSDVNGDALYASIADLVTLINMIVLGAPAPKTTAGGSLSASVTLEQHGVGSALTYDAEFEVGAVCAVFKLPSDDKIDLSAVRCDHSEMTLAVNQIENELRVLIYSLDAKRLPSGTWELLNLDDLRDLELQSVELADAAGNQIEVSIATREGVRPESFTLHQNYPNPFNPETTIEFDLDEPTRARLVVFNVMGQEVKTLLDRELTAGNHSVTWDGTDGTNRTVSSGIYLYRLETDLQMQSRKMMLLK